MNSLKHNKLLQSKVHELNNQILKLKLTLSRVYSFSLIDAFPLM